LIKEKPREEKQIQQRIRQVTTQQSSTDRAGSGKMDMRFTPDLSADAGPGAGEGVELQSKELSAEVFEEGQVDEPPQEDKLPPLEFPTRAREMGLSGTVKVRFVITYQGKAAGIEVLSSPSPVFTNEVRRVLGLARYKPGKNKGVPVSVKVTKSFEFTLE
jgi:TonB family protein